MFVTENQTFLENAQVNREQVLAAFKKFVDAGIVSPDDLSLNDPDVVSANAVLDLWAEAAQQQAEQDPAPDAALAYVLSRSTVHVDAGFSDPDYLDEVANDWLDQDLQTAEKAGLPAVAAHIKAKIDEINASLQR